MKVVFLERMVPDYRTRVFEMLHTLLAQDGIDFRLVTGQMRVGEDLHEQLPDGEWVHKIHNVYLYKNIHWPRMRNFLDGADMVIFHPQNAALGNFKLLARRYLTGNPKIGFFGHGSNIPVVSQEEVLPLRERFKAAIARLPDWWFPYTEMSRRLLCQRGVAFSPARMSVVNNAIDTTKIMERLSALPVNTRAIARTQLGINVDDPVALYCGRMRKIKLGVLFKAAEEIRRDVPNFHIILVGKGADADAARSFAQQYSWAHYLGPQYGDARLPYFAAADVFLMPGLVGLAILDAFAAGLPLFTTDCQVHSPEIEYLTQDRNGVMTVVNAHAYANAVVRVLRDRAVLLDMSAYARETARRVNMEAMADNFVRGIRGCLGLATAKE